MSGEELYEQWAPPYAIWAPWVKPAMFGQIGPTASGDAPVDWQTINIDWAPPATQRTALIIDLPGEGPLLMGLALAQKGYCPVVLYNCCNGSNPVINLDACIKVLRAGVDALRDPVFPPDAPPAFLIDSRRRMGDRSPSPGLFDNRWVVLPQDFPSGNFLQAQNIRQAVFIQQFPGRPTADLMHVLWRWQKTGVRILELGTGGKMIEASLVRPSNFGYAWYALLAMVGLRPNSAGGFGSVVPVPSQRGYG